MNFDCIIMNPPYGRTLPHNILNAAYHHLSSSKSRIVSLQPITPYQTFIESSKITEQNMSHIKDIELVKANAASEIFGITVRSDLGIIQMDQDIHNYKYQLNECKPIYDKIKAQKLKSWRSVRSCEANPKHFFYMNGDNGYAKGWHMKPTEVFNGQTIAKLVFDSEEEKNNFHDVVEKTWLYNFIYVLDNSAAVPGHFPWLGDAINPRTGKKGYTGEWIDDDLYKFFNITPDEQKIIEDTMKKYVTK